MIAADAPSPYESPEETPARACDGSSGMIEVEIGDALARVPPAVDGKLLARVLRAVKPAG